MLISSCNIDSNSKAIDKSKIEDFIISYEGFSSAPYICSGGILSIGYGTRALSKNDHVSESEAKQRLRDYLENITYKKIESYNFNQNQWIAFSSFDYNTGRGHKILTNDSIDCEKILLYNKVKGKTNKQLVKRRKAEYDLCIKK